MEKKSFAKFIWSLIKPFKIKLSCSIFISVLITLISTLIPLVSRMLVDKGFLNENFELVAEFSIIIFILTLISQGLTNTQNLIHVSIENCLNKKLLNQTFSHILGLKYKYFEESNFFENITVVENDITKIIQLVNRDFLAVLSSLLKVFGGIIGLIIINYRLTILVIVIVLLKYIFVHWVAKKRKTLFEKLIKVNRDYSFWYNDCLNGLKIIKLWNLFANKKRQYSFHIEKRISTSKKIQYLQEGEDFVTSLAEGVTELIVYIVGMLFIVNKQLSIGGLFSFIMYSSLVMQPIFIIMNLKYQLASVMPSFKDYLKFSDLEEEGILDIDKRELKEVLPTNTTISFRNAECTINNRKVINNISFDIYAREKIAIVGMNGSGKTTIFNLLLKLKDLSSGSIYVDGEDITEQSHSKYREKFSVISQEVFLFNDTIKENLFAPDAMNIEQFCIENKCNEILDSLINLPKGLNTHVGYNGAKLSGGEKQKVVFIRGIIKDSEFLLLDEATSNYDLVSERAFNEIIINNKQFKNILIITHRPEILQAVDKILLIENGQVIGYGSYEKLKGTCKEFKKYDKEG